MSEGFWDTTVEGLVADVRSRRTSARDVTERALARIAAVDGTVNAFVALDADGARSAARYDRRAARGG